MITVVPHTATTAVIKELVAATIMVWRICFSNSVAILPKQNVGREHRRCCAAKHSRTKTLQANSTGNASMAAAQDLVMEGQREG
jgi:hypothetical protein